MTEKYPGATQRPDVDPGRERSGNAFDKPTGFTGQAYSREDEAAEGRSHPSGHPLSGALDEVGPAASDSDRDIPPENGRRASFDAKTGEVRGSGSGEGEDFDVATSGGASDQA